MASVCGSSLSLMDAGVPIKAPVAGVAMGLVKEGDRYQVLTDILGDEDHLGDMDFKVAGTKDGITALQMDIKITSITSEIMKVALAQARDGRLHILEKMNAVISKPREKMSEWAPTHHHDQDRPREDPRRHRQGWLGHPRDHRGDRHDDRHRERRHRQDRLGQRRAGPRGPAPHRAHHRRRRGRADLRGQGRPAHGLRRLRRRSCRAATASCTSRRSRTSASSASRTSCARATSSRSRCSRSTARVACACRCATSESTAAMRSNCGGLRAPAALVRRRAHSLGRGTPSTVPMRGTVTDPAWFI